MNPNVKKGLGALVIIALLVVGYFTYPWTGSKSGPETTEQTDTTKTKTPIATQPEPYLLALGSQAIPQGRFSSEEVDETKVQGCTKKADLIVKATKLMLVAPTMNGEVLVQVDEKGKVVNYIIPRGKLTIS